MNIKHVVLDIYNLVQMRNPSFTAALIETIASATKYPWEECAYAFAESTNHFRALDPEGAFICDPVDFVNDIMARLDQSRYSPAELLTDFIATSNVMKAKTTKESIDAVRYLKLKDIRVTLAANTNLIPATTIAMQLQNHFSAKEVNYGLLTDHNHIQMPYDGIWLQTISTIQQVDPTITYSNTLFVTTNPRFASSAMRAGMQIAVLSGPDDLVSALERRIDASIII